MRIHNTKNKLQKIVATTIMLFSLLVNNSLSFVVYAEETTPETTPAPQVETTTAPEPTQAPVVTPEVPVVTSTPAPSPTTPVAPSAPSAPSVPSVPTAPSAPTFGSSTPKVSIPKINHDDDDEKEVKKDETPAQSATTNTETPSSAVVGTVSNGNVGDTNIKTGDADNSASIVTDANSNLAVGSVAQTGGAVVTTYGNGSGSDNTGSVVLGNNNNTNQDNTANVTNNLTQDTTTGANESSKNVGNTRVASGDANTSGTVITSVNTNVDGLMVAEFNVVDDQNGDIILDFGSGCLINCGTGSASVTNANNGSNSNNTGSIDETTNDTTFQNNDAVIENNLLLTANSGDNASNKNTGGDTEVTSGDANVSANVLNFANNNIAGNVIYAVVNIYGNLTGDIIMPDPNSIPCCANGTTASNTGNGSDSTNTSDVTQTDNTNIYQFNNAEIENNLSFDANTGQNNVSDNTGGDNSMETGDTNIVAQTVNIANMNLVGGNYWLVLVNEAGNWLGKIVGGPEGSNIAGSETMQFIVNDAGEIAVVNSGNGTGSENTGSVAQTNNTNITQTNDAKIVNNVNLAANTGRNSASQNTGGDTNVQTGDATIVANIVNFVNNNIVGDGKLFVTVVNVFGSWIGDFVGPGQKKEETHAVASVGGPSQSNTVTTTPTPTTTIVAAAKAITPKALANRVLGMSVSKDEESDTNTLLMSTTDNSDEDVLALGDSTTAVKSARAERNKVRVNLAWGLLALPIGVLFLLSKKKLLPLLSRAHK